ncbi:MAG: Uma2 family endonuclease [Chloroflexi bacterium]|nr:Uma2 family endonuclease [Chloroflexota bacterium]MCC6893434.1 Uma2 family endonuclease [Anaerolineae bacterium]
MVLRDRRYTVADLREIEQRPENHDKTFELINGEVREVTAPEVIHNYIISLLVRKVGRYLDDHDLGLIFGDNMSYTLANGDELIPDASFVAHTQITHPLPKRFHFAPDIAVEVSSPSNSERELLEKAESYLESGSKFVWIAYPIKRVFDVCHLTEDGSLIVRKVEIDGVLNGEDMLPGFTVAVKDIFPPDK